MTASEPLPDLERCDWITGQAPLPLPDLPTPAPPAPTT